MIYCPKYETWVFHESCDYNEDCWDLPNWDDCVKLWRKVRYTPNGRFIVEEEVSEE